MQEKEHLSNGREGKATKKKKKKGPNMPWEKVRANGIGNRKIIYGGRI